MKGERKLLSCPVPTCPEIGQRPPQRVNWRRTEFFRYRAQVEEIDGVKALGITVFDDKGKALQRFWQAGEQHGVQYFEAKLEAWKPPRELDRMYSSCIDSEYPTGGYGTESIFYSTEEDEKRAKAFLHTGEEPVSRLARLQKQQRESANLSRDERKREKLRERLQGTAEPGEEFDRWCTDVLMRAHRYWFFEPVRGKKRRGQCSHCLSKTELEDVKEYGRGMCPCCGSEVEYRSAAKLGNSRGMSFRYEAVLHEKDGALLLVRNYSIWMDIYSINGRLSRSMGKCEYQRSYFDSLGRMEGSYSRRGSNYKVTWEGWHEDNAGAQWAVIAPMNIGELRREAGISAPIEVLTDKGLAGRLQEIFSACRRRPEIEYLIKGRFYALAADELDLRWHRKTALLKGKGPEARFGLPRQEMDKLRQADAGSEALSIARSFYLDDKALKTEEIKDIQRLGISRTYAGVLRMMAGKSSPRKAINYLLRQTRNGKDSADHALQQWNDYVDMALKAGWNTENSQILWPKKLWKAHLEVQAALKAQKDKELCARLEAQGKRLERYGYHADGLLIRPAHSQKELIEEGAALNHCVGKNSYDRKMAEGRTAIFFIRKEEAPDKPYVTLELRLKDKKVIQCYGKGDRYPGDKVKNFYKKWEKEIVNGKGVKTA